MFDISIRGAQIIDGTGQAAFAADVGVIGDRIEAIGNIGNRARRVIEAAECAVIPGIIDPHSHADLILPLPPQRQAELMRCKLMQGITTTIIGNCGLGAAPIASSEAEPILRGINSWMTPQPVQWSWKTTGEYLARLEENGLALNIGALIPHGPVRISVMGLRKGEPSRNELKRMRALVEAGIKDGALGLSTGLIYPPGMYSSTGELGELARVVARCGAVYTSHIRGSSETLIDAVGELIEIGRRSGARVHHSHNEAVGAAHWQKIDRVLEMEEQANKEGISVTFDMFPYTAAATMMIAIYPPWSLESGIDKLIERLGDPKTRARIRRDIERVKPSWPPWREGGWPHNLVRAVGWENILIGYVESRANKRYENMSLAQLGAETGKEPFDAISDLIVQEQGKVSMLIFGISGERGQDELLAKYIRHPLGAFCTDAEDYGRGLPHPAAYGSFARILGHFVAGKGVIKLEEAVRKMTSFPAKIFCLRDRGIIRPGAYADLVILNPGQLRDCATYEHPRRQAQGIKYVIINGSIVVEDGQLLGPCSGKVIRRD